MIALLMVQAGCAHHIKRDVEPANRRSEGAHKNILGRPWLLDTGTYRVHLGDPFVKWLAGGQKTQVTLL